MASDSTLKLFGYFRSSATYRVRIALNLKGLDYSTQAIHLLRDGGQQFSENYRKVNPQTLVPALSDGDEIFIQSLAIIEYLEETYPQPALLPKKPSARGFVRAIAQMIACDIHPLNNLRVLKYLTHNLQVSEEQKNEWYRHWIAEGFKALEQMLVSRNMNSQFCYGDQPTLADVCLIPQIFNARRLECQLDDYPTLMQINQRCLALPAFAAAHPDRQPDAE